MFHSVNHATQRLEKCEKHSPDPSNHGNFICISAPIPKNSKYTCQVQTLGRKATALSRLCVLMSGVLDIDSWKDQADRPFYTNLMLEAYGSDWYRVASAQVGRVIDTFQQDMWRNPATQPVLEPRPRYEIPQISLAAIAYTRARGEMRNSLVEKFRLLGQSYYFDVFLAVGTCLAQMKSFRGNSTLREIMTTCEDQRRSSETNISESRAGYMWMDIGVKGHDAIVYYVWIKSKYWEVATFLHLKLEHDRWIRFSTYLKH